MAKHLDSRLTPARSQVADIRLRGIVDAACFVAGELRRVVRSSAPVRCAPAADASLETEALLGDAVTLYAEEDGFAFVQLVRDGYVGYLPVESFGPIDPEPTYWVTAIRTFLYPTPDLKRPPREHLSLGARIVVTGSIGDYLETPLGYIFARHAGPANVFETDYVTTAERLLGTPYLWGGRTSLGLDCSGLVQLCLDMAGLSCLRDADMQERGLGHALPLNFEGLQRGDFVFWRGHVGMMLDPYRLIHANGHHMAVAIEPLEEAVARILETSFGPVTGLRRL